MVIAVLVKFAIYTWNLNSCHRTNVPQGAIPRPPRRTYALGGGVPPRLGGRRTPRRVEHLRRSPSAPGRRSPSARGCCSRRPLPSARCWRGRRQSRERRRRWRRRQGRAPAEEEKAGDGQRRRRRREAGAPRRKRRKGGRLEAEANGGRGGDVENERRCRGRREGEREERMGGDKVVVGLLGWAVLMGLFFNSGFSGPLFFFSFRSIYDVYDKCIRIYMAPPSKPP